MYQAIKNNTVQYILDYEPTLEQLKELNCDSYEEYAVPEESYDAKKIRVMASLISSIDISSVDLEWIAFSDIEIWDIILARVFENNPHSQSALQAKVSSYILSVLSWNANEELFEHIQEKQAKINAIRAKFNLQAL